MKFTPPSGFSSKGGVEAALSNPRVSGISRALIMDEPLPLVVVGAGPHALALVTRLLEPVADPLAVRASSAAGREGWGHMYVCV